MKRRMTVKKALRITAEHFRWLEEHPKAAPNDWPGFSDYGIDVSIKSKDKYPLCEVADGNCMRCPLIALWIKDSGDLPDRQKLKSCLVRTSPWSIRQTSKDCFTLKDRQPAIDATRSIYLEAEYALEHGVREPDLSIYEVKRTRRVREGSSRRKRGGSSRRRRGEEETPTKRRRRSS